jgi:hypothetical protein
VAPLSSVFTGLLLPFSLFVLIGRIPYSYAAHGIGFALPIITSRTECNANPEEI